MARKKPARKKKASPKKAKTSPKKAPARKGRTKRTIARKRTRRERPKLPRRKSPVFETQEVERRGLGPASGGQSGDTEALPDSADVDSESVEELTEEGQDFEAEVIRGMEEAPEPDQGELDFEDLSDEDSSLD